MEPGDEISVNIERGKTLIIRFLATGELDKSGYCTVFFELNGQPRSAQIKSKKSITDVADIYVTADENDPNQFGAPMPGTVCNLLATEGKRVKKGQGRKVLSKDWDKFMYFELNPTYQALLEQIETFSMRLIASILKNNFKIKELNDDSIKLVNIQLKKNK